MADDVVGWHARQDEYLAVATAASRPTSPLNLIDHLERARRDPAHGVDWSLVDEAVVDRWCFRIDGYLDCADFDILRLLTLWFGYGGDLPDHVRDALRARFLGFRYWYTDPVGEDVVDQRWYWSENHRLIFHTCERLVGQAFGDDVFAVTGLTGAEHATRADALLAEWFEDKATYGFSEWHSDVYYEKDLAPLLTLAEFADDPSLAERATAFLDLLLFDLALHSHRGNNGVTHGRSYMKDKSCAPDQPVFGALKMCFDATSEPWPVDEGDDVDLLPRNEAATLLARAARYAPPDVLRRIATSTEEWVDREGMGLRIDPSEPLVDDPVRADGLSYTDPDMVPFWWDRGALTPWQLVPLTMATLDAHDLWRSDLFALFRTVNEFTGGDPGVTRQLAHDLHPMVNAGLLEEVHTYTWRNAHAMLSTAQSYRPGAAGFQHHVWQATLDEHAVVFTTHPGNAPSPNAGDYLDHDHYWTGSATLPRSAQHRRVAVHCYAPAYVPPDLDALAAFAYQPETHAFFPTERFDEVERRGAWMFGHRRDAYVALWSWRPFDWRRHDPAEVFTNGLREPFDLVAAGGADNVWIVEVGDADRWGSFDAFCDAVSSAVVDVDGPEWDRLGPHPGFSVRYESPAEGVLELAPTGPLRVDGIDVPLDGYPRFDNPFAQVARGETTMTIRDGGGGITLDLTAGTRRFLTM